MKYDNFRKPGRIKVYFWSAGISSRDTSKFVYEGHRVKVKVTGAEKRENPYSRNVELHSAVTPDRARKSAAAWGFRQWRIEWCDRHLCHVTGNARICEWSALD